MGCLSIMTCLNSVDWPYQIVPHFTLTLHFQYFLKKHKKTIKRQMCGGWKAEIICNGFETLFWMLQNRQQPQGEGSQICMEDPEKCHTSHFSNMSACRVPQLTREFGNTTTTLSLVTCFREFFTFSQPFLYFQVNIMTFLRITQLPFVLYFESMALILHSSKQLFLQKLFCVEQ